jgi:hypothetical protein
LKTLPRISLRILSYERPRFLVSCLKSVFRQSEPFADVEIHDNRSRFDFTPILARFPGVRLSQPEANLPTHQFFARAFRDPPAQPWLCVFHDDDQLKPEFCRNMAAAAAARPDCGAISCDGEVLDPDDHVQGPLLPTVAAEAFLRTPGEFARWFCDSFIPFPAAVYPWHARLAEWMSWATAYGRCTDVAFFSRIVQKSPIWIRPEKDFYYRRNPGQDSSGFVWWEETRRWDLQRELAQTEPAHLGYVLQKRRARLTQRWLNAWLKGEPRSEALTRADFSANALHRFVRNNKLAILRRLFRLPR